MAFNFKVKNTPLPYLWSDEFDTFDPSLWVEQVKVDNVGVVSGWLNYEPNASYGEINTIDMSSYLPGLSGTNYRLKSRILQVGSLVSTAPNFGFKFDGVGFYWYEEGIWNRRLKPQDLWLSQANTGIFASVEPIRINIQQKDDVFSWKVEYEESGHEIYNFDGNYANAVSGDGSNKISIGLASIVTHWRIDYIRMYLPA